MKAYTAKNIEHFVNRNLELKRLDQISKSGEASIVVVYGRRRVGKTVLLEKAFSDRCIFKFEGIEGESEEYQRKSILEQASQYFQEPLLLELRAESWRQVFRVIEKVAKEEKCTLYFEEVQWIANYKSTFISELKYFWDNSFSKNNQLVVLLCGSSPSFMLTSVLQSNSLHNRATEDFPISEFSIKHAAEFLPKASSLRDVFDAYLSVGGIPLYLKQLARESSCFLSICKAAFETGGFFVGECERIFVSSVGSHPAYKKTLMFLAKRRYAARKEIEKATQLSSGGRLSSILLDLESCGFIESYHPLQLKNSSTLKRYTIKDPYLQFYFRFIEPQLDEIKAGTYQGRSTKALQAREFVNFLALSFERFCRRNHGAIAKHLGFSAIEYKSGSYFQRGSSKEDRGYQIDLGFLRADKTLTLCEIKYTDRPVGKEASYELDAKIDRLKIPGIKRIQKVLISASGGTQSLIDGPYFDDILTLEDLANS